MTYGAQHKPTLMVFDNVVVEVMIRSDVAKAITRQVSSDIPFSSSFSDDLSNFLAESLDRRFQLPSPAQCRFAQLIASQLKLTLPKEVLENKYACHLFLNQHAERFHRHNENKKTARSKNNK